MKPFRFMLAILALLGLLATSCGGDDDDEVIGGSDDESADEDDSDSNADESDTEESDTEESDEDESDQAEESDEEESDEEVDTSEDETSVFDLNVGDCINSDALNGTVTDVGTLDCAAPHDYEVFHAFDVPDGDFPGDAGLQAAGEECFTEFEAFVGTAYAESALYVQTLTPTPESWGGGDREILCMLYATPDAGVTVTPSQGSAAGSGL